MSLTGVVEEGVIVARSCEGGRGRSSPAQESEVVLAGRCLPAAEGSTLLKVAVAGNDRCEWGEVV